MLQPRAAAPRRRPRAPRALSGRSAALAGGALRRRSHDVRGAGGVPTHCDHDAAGAEHGLDEPVSAGEHLLHRQAHPLTDALSRRDEVFRLGGRAQRCSHRAGHDEARIGSAPEGLHADVVEAGRGAMGARWPDLLPHDVHDCRVISLSREGLLARERSPEQHANGVDVGSRIELVSTKLLRRHVGRLRDGERLTLVPDGREARAPEVRQPGHTVDTHEDVLRRNVAVDKPEPLPSAVRRLVRSLEGREEIEDDGNDDRRRGPRLLDHQIRERAALDVVVDEEGLAFMNTLVDDRQRVRVSEQGADQLLLPKRRGREIVLDRVLADDLHREQTSIGRAGAPTYVERAHPSARDPRRDLVRADAHGHGRVGVQGRRGSRGLFFGHLVRCPP